MRIGGSCRLVLFFTLPAILLECVPSAFATSTPTTTSLAVTAGSNPVTTVASGSKVTLTATVSSGSTKVTTGQVNFCDASVSYCTDIHLLGTAQLTGAGSAVLNITPAIGSHSYKAVFAGTPHGTAAYASSASGAASLTVTGLHPAFSVFTNTSSTALEYNFTMIIGGNASTAPTGNVSFLNVSDNDAVLGTALLTASPAGLNFLNVNSPPLSWLSSNDLALGQPMIVGDFNGDGIPDIAGAGSAGCTTGQCWSAEAGALLGDGSGNFIPAASTNMGSSFNVTSVTVGDFNGDGKLDLAVGGSIAGQVGPTYSINILLGNGDGTFTSKGSVATGGAFQTFAAADFNGDGIPDLAVVNTTADIVTILLGNGDGTFTASTAATSPTGSIPVAIAVADLNGDGIPDLAIGNDPQGGSSGSLTILLGNGDGTFTAAASPATPSGINAIAVADFEGDGKEDIAVANGAVLTMLKGNGDGTFASSTITPETGSFNSSLIVTGDFNGDGKVDLAFAGYNFLLLGNGDGTFTVVPLEIPSGVAPSPVQIAAGADFNGDGFTDLTGPSVGDEIDVAAVVLLAANQTATASATGISLPPGTGSQEVDASYPGDSNYGPATSAAAKLTAGLATPSAVLSVSPNPAIAGASVTLKATVSGGTLTPTGTVSFYDGSVLLGSVILNASGVATFATNALVVGSNSVTVSYGGDVNYNLANSAPVVVTLVAAGTTAATVTLTPAATTILSSQTDTVAVSVAGATGAATPTGTITLSSGSYSAQQTLASGAAGFTIPAGALASGANTLAATYSGDATYAAASAMATITVTQAMIEIPTPTTVSAGSNATATATLTAGTSYSGTMNLTCALTKSPTGAVGLPACNVNPASVTLKASGSATSVLTLTTTAPSSASLAEPLRKNLWGTGGSVVLAVMFLCGIPARRRRFAAMLVLACLGVAFLVAGCGGSGGSSPTNPGTTSGAYTFTVTGTDSANSSITTSTTVNLTVQ